MKSSPFLLLLSILLLLLNSGANAMSSKTAVRKLLVAGGSGYVGRQVCREALMRGWSVTSLSRRGVNPLPGTVLDKVNWVKGSADDSNLLETLAKDADAFVHSIGLLLDSKSGLANLNFITSGSRSVPGKDATYDSEMRLTALALLEAAKRTQKTGTTRPFAFVSAAEVGWPDNALGSKIEASIAPEWLSRYLSAKRAVELELTRTAADAGVRPILARPSFMWDPFKLDILPLLPIWSAGNALNIGGGTFSPPLRVESAGAGILSAIEDSQLQGVVSAAQLEQLAPLAVKRRPDVIDTFTSGLASISRLPYGSTVAAEITSGALKPTTTAIGDIALQASALRLYEFEGCPFCRRVREVATYLDLCYTVIPCGRGSKHRTYVESQAIALGKTRPTFPYLEDDVAGVKLFESEDIIKHLLARYGAEMVPLPPPSDYFLTSTLVTGWMPTLLRLGRGGTVSSSASAVDPKQPLQLYSYEGNQFCRLVREALTELDLPHVVLSVGKGSPRRAELITIAGSSTAPYLIDPNTNTAMRESADIVEYLYREYATA